MSHTLPAGRPLAVDLFCGRGGWTKGLLAAGFAVVGTDLMPQPDYPDGAAFVQADARSLRAHDLHLPARPYAVVASPPCQPFSAARPTRTVPPAAAGYELVAHAFRLVAELRPTWWAIENVAGALKWWGPMFGTPDVRAKPYYVWGHLPDTFRPAGPYPSKLHHRDPGRRSEIPAGLAGHLAESLMSAWFLQEAGGRVGCEVHGCTAEAAGYTNGGASYACRAHADYWPNRAHADDDA